MDTIPTRPDRTADPNLLSYETLNLWIHQDILDALDQWGHLRDSSASVLQRLAAHGRTSVVKGCKGSGNRGWRRSPLGGNGGMQYYLWWTVEGNEQSAGLDGLRPGDIVVRAIRHHDDHAALRGGNREDYDHGQSPRMIENDIGSPWTTNQLSFVDDEHPVRVVLGQPGSGKTTALWRAVEARAGQRVLYLTWSRELTSYAKEHFAAFAPKDVRVEAQDFLTFLGEVCGSDVERQPSGTGRTLFDTALRETKLGRAAFGPWQGRRDALFAEIRAILLGTAVPEQSESVPGSTLLRLRDSAYRESRDQALGGNATRAVLKVVKALEPHVLPRVFPELAAAAAAVDRLRNGLVPSGHEDFDRIVIDEAQDLTLLETLAVVEHCRAIARVRGQAPWLLFAGDDGQTVRPSGFDWGAVNDLLAAKVGTPKKFNLEGNLRCPGRIADVIDRASERYRDLGKGRRPTKQQPQSGGRDLDAQLFHVVVPSRVEAPRLLEQLKELENAVVVAAETSPPTWVPSGLRDVILTPAEAKGLEYQAVCVLDPGRLLIRLGEEYQSGSDAAKLEEHLRRTAIDRLRVALSRSTETLAFIDVEADDNAVRLSRELLGDAAPFEPDDLVDHLADTETTVEERVVRRIDEASTLVENRPAHAWLRAEQAVKLLGNPALPNGVADRDIRDQAQTNLLQTAARLLIDGVPAEIAREDIVEAAMTVSDVVAEPPPSASDGFSNPDRLAMSGGEPPSPNRVAFAELVAWSESIDRTAVPPFSLLDATLALGDMGDWLKAALRPVRQTLRNAIRRHATTAEARRFNGNVEGWLELTGHMGDVTVEARQLRVLAFETLIDRDTDAADRVLVLVVPQEAPLLARLREAQERFDEAAEAFERAEMPTDALRTWRKAGRWERAVGLAHGTERKDLEWLIQLEQTVTRRPGGLAARLTGNERERLATISTATSDDRFARRLGTAWETAPIGGKYERLRNHLQTITTDRWRTTFDAVESVVGSRLPDSAYRHPAWWSNAESHTQAKAWMAAGFGTHAVDVERREVTFVRRNPKLIR